jgi:hypothetical protein
LEPHDELINIFIKEIGKQKYRCQLQYWPSETTIIFDEEFDNKTSAKLFGLNYLLNQTGETNGTQ